MLKEIGNHSNKLVKTPAAYGQHMQGTLFQYKPAFEIANLLSIILFVIFW